MEGGAVGVAIRAHHNVWMILPGEVEGMHYVVDVLTEDETCGSDLSKLPRGTESNAHLQA